MKSHTHYLWFTTKQRQEIIDITDQVAEQVRESGVAEGLSLVSAMHISASVFVNDHESGLWADILKWLDTTIAPWDPKRYRHNETGEDNAAAQVRSGVVLPRFVVPVPLGIPRRDGGLEPLEDVRPQARFVIVHEHGRGDVHRAHQREPLCHTTLPDLLGDLLRDVDDLLALLGGEPEVVCMGLHLTP